MKASGKTGGVRTAVGVGTSVFVGMGVAVAVGFVSVDATITGISVWAAQAVKIAVNRMRVRC